MADARRKRQSADPLPPSCASAEHARRDAARTQEDVYERAASMFLAAGNATRLKILRGLRDGPVDVGELARAVGVRMNLVSKHLAVLRESRLVTTERQGRRMLYGLTDDATGALVDRLVDFAGSFRGKPSTLA